MHNFVVQFKDNQNRRQGKICKGREVSEGIVRILIYAFREAGNEVLKVIEHEGAITSQGSIVACFNEKQVEELGNRCQTGQ